MALTVGGLTFLGFALGFFVSVYAEKTDPRRVNPDIGWREAVWYAAPFIPALLLSCLGCAIGIVIVLIVGPS